MIKTEHPKALHVAAQAIFDKKGMNIIALDVRGISSLADYFVICEGSVDRHVKALANCVEDALKKLNWSPLHTEGLQSGDWVVLDYGDVVFHLFTPELRERYALETLWKNSQIVDLQLR